MGGLQTGPSPDAAMTRLSPSAAFDYAVDPGAGLAVARMTGTLTGPDMAEIVTAVHADADWEPAFDAIWDCSVVRAHVVQPDEVPPLVEAVLEAGAAKGSAGRDVLIENASLARSAFSEMLVRRLRRHQDAHVVRRMEQALAVLGLDALPPALVLEGGAGSNAPVA